MPITMIAKDTEFEVATQSEVAALAAAFEAAHVANAEVEAQADERFGSHPRYGSEEYTARRAFLEEAGTGQRMVEAQNALRTTRALPVGTVVRFSTSAGWEGTDTDEGTITEVTEASYVVSKIFGGKARLDRYNAHEYRSNYSGNVKGARGLVVLRTPAMDRQARAGQRERQRILDAERAVYQAQVRAVQAQRDALAAQHGILSAARAKAVQVLLARHAAEYEALVTSTLDLLALDAPGRTETAPVEA